MQLKPRTITITDYAPAHRGAFKSLNLAWIEKHFVVEDSDSALLDDPEGAILATGGFIFVALDGDEVVGVCALLAQEPGVFKLAKMAVNPSARGRGIGRLLGNAAVQRARLRGASRVELYSNTVLAPAITLYESLGFREVPLENAEHVRSNIYMVLDLTFEGGNQN